MPREGIRLRLRLGNTLPVNAIGGTPWRDNQSQNLLENWRYGFGEATVSGDLDIWTGQVTGAALTAPSSGQRPTAGTGGWQFTSANTSALGGAAAIAAAVQGATPYTLHTSASVTGNGIFLSFADDTVDNKYHVQQRVSNVSLRTGRRDGTNANLDAAITFGTGRHTISYVFDGTLLTTYFDGVAVAGPSTPARDPSPLNVMGLGFINRLNPANYTDCFINEVLIYAGALTSDEMSSVHNNLDQEYPP